MGLLRVADSLALFTCDLTVHRLLLKWYLPTIAVIPKSCERRSSCAQIGRRRTMWFGLSTNSGSYFSKDIGQVLRPLNSSKRPSTWTVRLSWTYSDSFPSTWWTVQHVEKTRHLVIALTFRGIWKGTIPERLERWKTCSYTPKIWIYLPPYAWKNFPVWLPSLHIIRI